MKNTNSLTRRITEGLGLFIVIIVGSYIIILNTVSFKTDVDKFSILANFSQVLSLVVAIINLILILTFFVSGKNDKLNEQKNISKSHWFNDFIYEKNMSNIQNLFNESIKIVDRVNNLEKINFRKELRNEFKFLSGKINEVNNTFIFLIEIINENLAKELYKLMEQYEDKLTQKLQYSFNTNTTEDSLEIINYYKKEFIKKIYQYNMSLYE